MVKLLEGAEERLKKFKIPKKVTNGVPIMCPNCKQEKLYTYLSTAIISGMAKVGDFCCANCHVVLTPKSDVNCVEGETHG